MDSGAYFQRAALGWGLRPSRALRAFWALWDVENAGKIAARRKPSAFQAAHKRCVLRSCAREGPRRPPSSAT